MASGGSKLCNYGRFLMVSSLVLLGGCAQWYPETWVFWGHVVDAETQAPIEGAVFAVLWYQRPVAAMDGPRYLETAAETVTDSHGDFRLEGVRPGNWHPLRYRDRYPAITLLAVGYNPLAYTNFGFHLGDDSGHGRPASEAEPETFRGDVTKLSRAATRTQSEYLARGSPCDLSALGVGANVELSHLPRLLEAVNRQRASLGVPQYPPPSVRGERGR
jgi:hypothetical protein